jgi:hypothetical protein
LDIMAFSQRFALCGEARNANKFRVLRLGKNRQGCHIVSPFVRQV